MRLRSRRRSARALASTVFFALAFVPVRAGAAYRTGLLATASNPLTILTWAAVFSGAAVTCTLRRSPIQPATRSEEDFGMTLSWSFMLA